jgi:hypothetical protein
MPVNETLNVSDGKTGLADRIRSNLPRGMS